MADATKKIAIDVLVENITQAEKKLDRIRQAIVNTDKADRQRIATLKQEEAVAVKAYKTQVSELKKVELQQKKTAKASSFLGTSIAYLASDIGFFAQNPRMGLLAIGNNLSQVVVGFNNAQKAGESFAKTMRTVLKTQGVMIALQLAISLLTQLPVILKRLRKEVNLTGGALQKKVIDKLSGSYGAIGQVRLWANVLNTATVGTEQHTIALQNLKKLGYDPAIMSLEKFIQLKQSSALLDAFTSITSGEIAAKMGAIYKKEQELREQVLAEETARKNAQAATDPEAAGFYSGNITIARDKQDQIKKDIQKLNDDIIDINKFGATKIKEIIDKDPDIWKVLFPQLTKDKDLQTISQKYDNMIALFGLKGLELIEKRRELALQGAKTSDDKSSINAYFDLLVGRFNQDKAMEGYKKWMSWQETLKAKLEEANKWQKQFEAEKTLDEQEREAEKTLEQQHALHKFEDYEKRKADIKKYYSDKRKKIQEAEDDADAQFLDNALGRMSTYLNQAAQLNEKYKALSIAATIMSGARAIVASWKSWKEDGPFGEPGNTIAAVAEGLVIGGITAASVSKIKNANNGSVSGSGGGKPQFNIIGQSQNSALQATIEEQTGVIGNAAKDNKVVLVTSELEMKQNENKVAVEQTSL